MQQPSPAAAAVAAASTTPALNTWTPAPDAGKGSRQSSKAPIVSVLTPEEAKDMRNMQIANYVCTLLLFGCALAIILIVRYNLVVYVTLAQPITIGGYTFWWDYKCLAAIPLYQGTCEFAYALAALSIFFGCIIALLMCLTLDCCGMGRVIEAICDTVGLFWWIAGTVVLAYRASEANNMGMYMAQYNARNAVVAMAAISAFIYLVLLVTNLILIQKMGKAYKRAVGELQQQQQQFVTGAPDGAHTAAAAAPAVAKVATDVVGSNAV